MKTEIEKDLKKTRDLVLIIATKLGLDKNGNPTGNGLLGYIKENIERQKSTQKEIKELKETLKGNITVSTLKTWGQTIKGTIATTALILGLIGALKGLGWL